MIYIDSSVILAALFGESRRPVDAFWEGPRVASRLTDLEVRVGSSRRERSSQFAAKAHRLLSDVRFVEITGRAVQLLYTSPPRTLRTLDAIHLATLAYVNSGPRDVPLATYDRRLAAAAQAMGFQVIEP